MKEIRLTPYIKQAKLGIRKALELGYTKYLDFDEMVYALVKRDFQEMDEPIKICFRKRSREVWTEKELYDAVISLLWNYEVRI